MVISLKFPLISHEYMHWPKSQMERRFCECGPYLGDSAYELYILLSALWSHVNDFFIWIFTTYFKVMGHLQKLN